MSEEVKNVMEEMDWDSPISAEASEAANIPPEGEYGFEVIGFEKTVSKSGKKMAKINLKLDETAQFWKVYDYLVLTTNMEWKLAQFFECLGLKKKGESLTAMPWGNVMGGKGRAKIKHEEYNGQESCKVDRYLPAAAAEAPTAPQMPFEV